MMTSRGSVPAMMFEMAARASETTSDARALTGISSSRIAGEMSGRTSRIRRSSVRRTIGRTLPAKPNRKPEAEADERPDGHDYRQAGGKIRVHHEREASREVWPPLPLLSVRKQHE